MDSIYVLEEKIYNNKYLTKYGLYNGGASTIASLI